LTSWLNISSASCAAFSLSGALIKVVALYAGDYELMIGFHKEPAYQGEPNGFDLFVTNTTDHK
jgi:hypothetical protein